MKDYNNIEDFIADGTFQHYVNHSKASDVARWEKWIAENPGKGALALEAKEVFIELQNQGSRKVGFSVEAELSILKDTINSEVNNNNSGVEIKLRRYLQLAAAIILLLSLGLTGILLFNTDSSYEDVTYTEISAPKGARVQVTLEDGTKIWLNADSKLKYPSQFTNEERRVYLTGEGYFDVAKEKDRPFVLLTADVKVDVLGTTFNVKSYPEDNFIETTLETGSLKIIPLKSLKSKNIKQEIMLKPKQKVVLYKDESASPASGPEEEVLQHQQEENIQPMEKIAPIKEAVLFENVDTEIDVAWKDDKLIFRSEKLEDIIKKLERWYDVNITIDEDLRSRVYSGTFQDETVEQALDAICLTSNLKYSIDKNNIRIYK